MSQDRHPDLGDAEAVHLMTHAIEHQREKDKQADEERTHRQKYPEATKWSDAHDDATVISNFLEWLLEKKRFLGGIRETHDSWDDTTRVIDLEPEKLLKEYFEIDEQKLDKERRAMLDDLRKKNGEER